MRKILVKGLGMDNINLSISLLRILTAHNFDMGNIGIIFKSRPGKNG
jgi:hypothetical protein